MPDLAEMTRSAMDVASDVLDNAADANPAKAAKDANPKELAVAGIALAALPVAVEQIAKRVAPARSRTLGTRQRRSFRTRPLVWRRTPRCRSLSNRASSVA